MYSRPERLGLGGAVALSVELGLRPGAGTVGTGERRRAEAWQLTRARYENIQRET